MDKFQLTIVASGLDSEAEDFEDRFFEAGCDDATISVQKGVIIVEFNREAKSFLHALVSAVENVRATGARVERIEPDHLVSLSDIAARSGMSKAAVSLYSKGKRARDFPFPVARVTTESPLWDWVHVSRWMYHNSKVGLDDVIRAKMVREANISVVTDSVHLSGLAKHLQFHEEAMLKELA